MSNRTLIVRAAAMAALFGAAGLRAEVAPSDTPAVKPVYLAEEAAPRKPLMALLNQIGIAEPLEDAGVTVGGVIAGSYTYNFDDPASDVNFGRTFDSDDQDPTLNQIDLFAEKAVTVNSTNFQIGGRFDIIYGSDARYIHSLGLFDHYGFYNVPATDDGDNPDNQWDLNQAYVDLALPVGTGLKIRAGKFNTLLGYEVINPAGNLLFSRGLLFNYAIPLTHTGVLGTYVLNDKVTVTGGITRGWDTSVEDDNDTLDFLGQVNYTLSDKTNLAVSLVTGPDQFEDNGNWRTVVDVIVTHKAADNLTLALNADYGYEANSVTSVSGSDAQWYGLAAYASLAVCPQASINFRAEYFNDEDGARVSAGVGGAEFMEATLGLSLKPFADDSIGQNLVIRPEIRWDYADENVFDDGGDNNQFTAAIDAYFTF